MARTVAARSSTGNTNARYRIWQTARLYARQGHLWTLRDMAAVCETSTTNVGKYAQGLVACGYLQVAVERQRGVRGGDRFYELARDTGPRAPRLRLDGTLWDANTQREVQPDE